jgi:hypothetical protein
MELEESFIYGLWPKRLLIFEDRIETRNFELLRETTESRKYGWIDHVTVSGGRWFANLLIRSHWGRPVLMRGLDRDTAERAKALIEERVARGEARPPQPRKLSATSGIAELVRKLSELRDAGVLSQKEFEIKKRAVMATGQRAEHERTVDPQGQEDRLRAVGPNSASSAPKSQLR